MIGPPCRRRKDWPQYIHMSKLNKETQKSVRVVLPLSLYLEIKDHCIEWGDMSRLVRHLLRGWVEKKGTMRQVYDEDEPLPEGVIESGEDESD